MRLDIFLKTSRLVSKRALANEMCDRGLVLVNGTSAKPSRGVSAGDVIRINGNREILTAEILQLPAAKQVSKEKARELYSIIDRKPGPDILT